VRRIVTASVCLAALLTAVPAASAAPVVDLPVAFDVRNTNSSGVPCPSDGAAYTLRGHLVAPRSALERPRRTVTLYVHGFNSGEWNWRFPLSGYDVALEMARLGHVSLTFDRLGFDSSDFPDGFMTCFGAHADMAHQVVQALRAGSYTVDGRAPVAFSKVVLAGHDTGGTAAEIEAYSYKDVDGLIVMNIADGGRGYLPPSPSIPEFADVVGRCAAGGERAERDDRGGYARFIRSDDDIPRYGLPNSEPEVVDLVLRLVNKNPCGDVMSLNTAFTVDRARVREIEVPVLLLYTELDFNMFAGAPAEEQRSYFTGSDDVSLVTMEGTGHFPFLDRNAPRFRSIVSEWLGRRGFGGRERKRVERPRGS
jgi:pimeloyl-ACP methyl ester carboxylesterase